MADRTAVLTRGSAGNGSARSASEIVQDVVRDIQTIVRSEIRLARAEMTEKAQRAGKAGGLLAGAAAAALFAAACFLAACIAALALVMPVWLAALLMTVLLICIAAACYAGGRGKLKQVNPVPEQTVQTLKDDVEWVKSRTR